MSGKGVHKFQLISFPQDAADGKEKCKTRDDGAVDHVQELVGEVAALRKRDEGR